MNQSFDEFWEQTYSSGEQLNKYPYDSVVSFVFKNYPKDKARANVKILEVGCGAGNNLWFTAREGFDSYGVDASSSCIEFARKRFGEDNLICDFKVGDFTSLPYGDDFFDLVIDRGALTETGFSFAKDAVREVLRVLKPGGVFHFNPYSKSHVSYKVGRKIEDGLVTDITKGLTRAGKTCFYDFYMVKQALKEDDWQLKEVYHKQVTSFNDPEDQHSEWLVLAQKK